MENSLETFYKGKKVLITGHTGFKGSWLSLLLLRMGAIVSGYALSPPTNPSMYELCKLNGKVNSYIGDVRDLSRLQEVFHNEQPEVVFHLAAQPIVLESYQNPVGTYETNVLGTVNVLECIRNSVSVKSVIIVTTDKVYENVGKYEGYVESDNLNGYDPYSNSKSCAELVSSCYVNSFLKEKGVPLSTLRAGNVIGGGDFAPNRLLPDCMRALESKEQVCLRNPMATRPFQHVLEPLVAYMTVAMRQTENLSLAGSYNVGPKEDALRVKDMIEIFSNCWNEINKSAIETEELPAFSFYEQENEDAPHEAAILQLDSKKIRGTFDLEPKWDSRKAIESIVQWTTSYFEGRDVINITMYQIEEYLNA